MTIDDTTGGKQYHYGIAGTVTVKTGTTCYHENGQPSALVLKAGKVVLEKEAEIETFIVDAKSGVEAVDNGAKVETFISEASNINVKANTTISSASTTELEGKEYEAGNVYFKLSDNIELSKPVIVTNGCNMIVDLAGKTISASSLVTNTNFTDKDALFVVAHGGSLTILDSAGNGEIKSTGSSVYAAIKMTSGSENNSELVAKLTVNGGSLTGEYYAICGNGDRHNTEIIINGGTFTGNYENDNLGIYHPQDGKLVINSGTLIGYSTALEIRAGELEINGGTFVSKASTYSCNPNNNGSTTVGAAVAIVQHTTELKIAASINGGTFTGAKSLVMTDVQANDASNVSVSITGGTFNGDIINLADPNWKLYLNN